MRPTAPVSGTFAGLPEGSTVSSGGTTWQISYAGGDGNDVTLTLLTPLQQWRLANLGSSANAGSAADLADPDADGISNLVEYAPRRRT